jgi:hypothetical protein
MAEYEGPGPVEVVDRLLYRDAQQMLGRHSGADLDGRCEWCDRPWPCPARRLAERAEVAAHLPRADAWSARHAPGGARPSDHQVVAAVAAARVPAPAVVHPLRAPSVHD